MKVVQTFLGWRGNPQHGPTLLLVALFATLVSARWPGRVVALDSGKLVDLVLPVAGTIVALGLPAAQLAQSVLDRFLATAEELIKAGDPLPDIHDYLARQAEAHRRLLGATRFTVVYGMAAFLVALLHALGVLKGLGSDGAFVVADVAAALAAGLLVAAVLWFVPVIRIAFDFSSGDSLLRLLAAPKPRLASTPLRLSEVETPGQALPRSDAG